MRKIVKYLFAVAILFLLSSCTSNGGATHTYGDWKYKINTKTKEVMLIGFSKEGKKKETIVLPTMIKGKKVTTIGYLKDFALDDSKNGVWTADFRGATYKNIYFHSLLTTCDVSSGYGIYWSATSELKVYYGKIIDGTRIMLRDKNDSSNCYIPVISKIGYEEKIYSNYNSANVVYYLNDDTDSTFFCDDCDGTKVNVIPPDPYRDGYEFKGWYKEKEGINEFDFENYIIPNKEYDGENVYILNETSIYAKWEKIDE